MSKEFIKYLNKLSLKERAKFLKIIEDIELLRLDNLDVKKLQGFKNRFRARVDKIRIIFEIVDGIGIIYEINTRGDVY